MGGFTSPAGVAGLPRRAARWAALVPYGLPNTPARTLRRLRSPSLRNAVTGRTILITGASSGIGRASALKLGAAGAEVILVARTAEALDEVRDEIAASGGTAHAHPCDLTDLEAVDALAAEVLEAHEGVDILINNAGHSIRRSVTASRADDYERTARLNYLAATRLTLALLPAMESKGFGHVVNVTTLGLQTATPRFSAYLGSKAALEAFGRSLAAEGRSKGIRVTSVHLPLVRTEMIAPTKLYRSAPALSAEQAADFVCEGISTRAARLSPRAAAYFELMWTFAPDLFVSTMHTAFQLTRDRSERDAAAGEPQGLAPSVIGGVGRALGLRL